MKTIWKFPLEVTDVQSVRMPRGARILCVQVQGGVPCLWAEVDPQAASEDRTLRIYGTGHPMAEGEQRVYIGTFQLVQMEMVFHVYEVNG
jgi:hypothetical protein